IAHALDVLNEMKLEGNSERQSTTVKAASAFDRLRLLAVKRLLESMRESERSKVASSEAIASVIFGKNGASYRSRAIRDWSDYFVKHEHLPELRQGKHLKTKTLIDDEDVQAACRAFIRQLPADKRDANAFMKWVNSELQGECALETPVSISERT